ncbi:MAG: hypothetical protein GW941_01560 [Candidatus Pacebacteria bacterium]|nr:hypothetical protein [Candidatus Paceibacterota bacterium]
MIKNKAESGEVISHSPIDQYLDQELQTGYYSEDLKKAKNRLDKLKDLIDKGIPSKIIQTIYRRIEKISNLNDILSILPNLLAAFEESNRLLLVKHNPDDTLQGYYLSDFLEKPFEFLNEEDYPWLKSFPDNIGVVIILLRESEDLIKQEWLTQIGYEKFLTSLVSKYGFAKEKLSLEDILKIFYKSKEDKIGSIPSVILESSDKKQMIQWWNSINSSLNEDKIVDFTLSDFEAINLEIIFHRCMISQVMNHDLESEDNDSITSEYGNNAMSAFESVSNDESVSPIGFKIHIKASIKEQEFYQLLQVIEQICSENSKDWKCRVPTSEFDLHNHDVNSRYEGTMITIYPSEFDQINIPPKESDFYTQWVEMINLGKEIDEQLARFSTDFSIPGTKTDLQLRSSIETSNRVQIRFGGNLSDSEVRERLMDPNWEDNRDATFEDNLIPTLNIERLEQLAQGASIIIHRYQKKDN